jgi:hypothetical protein
MMELREKIGCNDVINDELLRENYFVYQSYNFPKSGYSY